MRGENLTFGSPLTGRFNIQNILASCAAGLGLGIPPAAIEAGIRSVQAVPGRFERIVAPARGLDGDRRLRAHAGRAGELPAGDTGAPRSFGREPYHHRLRMRGEQGRGKRPIMGRIAAEWSDVTIVTSDNPRNEDPDAIIGEILAGMPAGGERYAEVNRRAAIRAALLKARSGDVVLVAGKGHETSQVIGATRHHFDDREEVRSFIQENG